ncbi:MAG: homoserine O-acetyltransferase [Flavobacteriales bacterium]|nr:homoserine O-acetyltransferase [Flavobacteriales bacterium]
MAKEVFKTESTLHLDCGKRLNNIEITYHTYGELNEDKSNVVWVCHALTANSNVEDWWGGLFGEDRLIGPDKFVVCANIIGSCFGSTGPTSINSASGKPYFLEFPMITMRDISRAHILLKEHLGIDKISLGLAGSMGGSQILEWTIMEPELFEKIVVISTGAQESAWRIAIHTTQRMAIENDKTWGEKDIKAASNGLKLARAIGILTYRNYEIFQEKQLDAEPRIEDFRAASYIQYQGQKLLNRFNAYSYWYLTKAMDAHNVAWKRGNDIEKVLNDIKTDALVIGTRSDLLSPIVEQKYLAEHLGNGVYKEIDSEYGHDGFLTEIDLLTGIIKPFMN